MQRGPLLSYLYSTWTPTVHIDVSMIHNMFESHYLNTLPSKPSKGNKAGYVTGHENLIDARPRYVRNHTSIEI